MADGRIVAVEVPTRVSVSNVIELTEENTYKRHFDICDKIMEAEAWAYLAIRSIKKLPLTFPMTTGCEKAVSGGVMVEV